MVIRVSSSIANFRDKLKRRTGLREWTLLTLFEPCVFFGMYHVGDYLRFLLHRGRKKVFWCGADILSFTRELSIWQYLIIASSAEHYCENPLESDVLERFMGIDAEIRPMIFDTPQRYQVCYKPSLSPHVWLCMHAGREVEYGLGAVLELAQKTPDVNYHIYGTMPHYAIDFPENIYFHGRVSEEQFDTEVRGYQASLRLNAFDGFSEATAKSVLMGQHPVSNIKYPCITQASDMPTLVAEMEKLKDKTEPNHEAARYWSKKLEENLHEVIS